MTEEEAPRISPGGGRGAGRRPPRKPSPQSLDNAAQYYLARYAASAESLRRVLRRRVDRAARAHGDVDVQAAHGWIEDIIRRYLASGLLNDALFAAARARTLHRRGASARLIREKLAIKGLDTATVDAAIAAIEPEEDGGDRELEAARALARRRRLGPWRRPGQRAEARMRDLAALARAGFAYDVCKAVVDGPAGDGSGSDGGGPEEDGNA
ncbi:MAG TPA: RecX family transcriptional regulator [Azospirillaceae bacterium]|nr:RecX family transcriptional regulator [Azospirillaceae bacterium]